MLTASRESLGRRADASKRNTQKNESSSFHGEKTNHIRSGYETSMSVCQHWHPED